ncbi:MAG: NUDIX hydrolase N-terminal domain-containing protein [Ignavibacteriaceae bacterium]|jgi:hypothetical protein
MEPKWLEWAKSLQAIAQNGLTYAVNEFDVERYNQIRNISAEIMASNSDGDFKILVKFVIFNSFQTVSNNKRIQTSNDVIYFDTSYKSIGL